MDMNGDVKNMQNTQRLHLKITPSKKQTATYYHRFLSEITIILAQLFKTPAP
jgi:hypothetical protein